MKALGSNGAHSALVKMRLHVNGSSIRITHMGPDYLLVDCPIDHEPCDARIFLQVDDDKCDWAVKLPRGISRNSNRVALALAE